MTKYLLIETWNGEGYSDSTARIVETSLPNEYAKAVAETAACFGTVEVYSSKYMNTFAWSYAIGEDSGLVVIYPVPTNWTGVVLKPMINDFETLTTEEDLNSYIDLITEFSEEYKEGGKLLGEIHHGIQDEDIILFLKETLRTQFRTSKNDEYEYDEEGNQVAYNREGNGLDYEVWKSKITGQQIRVPIEIKRDWNNIETIEQQ